jgi:uncharacterized membrane protein
MLQTKVRILGVISLVCIALSSLVSLVGAVFTVVGVIIWCYLFYILTNRYGQRKLFNLTCIQSIVATPIALWFLYITVYPDVMKHDTVMFITVGMFVALLLFLGYTDYVIAKHLRVLSENTHNKWFYYSGKLLSVSVYTMPIIIGLYLSIIAGVVFVVGCILYKE